MINARDNYYLMKGQNKIVNEILLFALGISITAAIIINFQIVHNSANDTTIYSNFNNVANTVINGITQVLNGDEGKVVVRIPDKISSEVYRIKISSDSLIISSIDNPSINITKDLFNISSSHIIYGDVISSARYVEIVSETTGLTKFINVKRAERYA